MKVQLPVRLVSATRQSESGFWRHTLLGKSLRAMPDELRPELALRFDNVGELRVGLPTIYNRAIEAAPRGTVLLFVHDDVYLHDAFLQARLSEAIEHADIVGLAGSRGVPKDALSWALGFTDELACTGWHQGPSVRLAGAVSHTNVGTGLLGPGAPPIASRFCYGRLQAEVDWLDGLFLAAPANTLRASSVRFDERFDFHLYDTDFCRQARAQNFVLSTYPILVSHGSGGNYDSPEWKAAARLYRQKWSEVSPPAPSPAPPPALTESPPP
jgi:GT2 family glycosyltransferase